ncbi:unnamed protein product [Auanema sp. JU1783]|nr:unnamed protein product [Auanema sp. JU1783]
MGSLKSFGHQLADSVRRLLRSPRQTPSRMFFKRRDGGMDTYSDLSTPNSTRSVSFIEAISWPFIDDEIIE